MNAQRNSGKGMTLLEVLVVAAVIGLLAVTLLISVRPKDQLAKGRDARRKADLELLSQKLEDYYNDYDEYPNALTCNASFDPYLVRIPCDPRGGSYFYVTTTGQEYKIYTTLEYTQDPVIASSSCSSGCGPGNQYNYGVSSPNVGL